MKLSAVRFQFLEKCWALSLHILVYKHETEQNTYSHNVEGPIIPEYVLESNKVFITLMERKECREIALASVFITCRLVKARNLVF